MTRKFPTDASLEKVIKTPERLEFHIVRTGNHVAMVRDNADGTRTPLSLPNHRRVKGSTLRTILTQAQIARDEFLAAYQEK